MRDWLRLRSGRGYFNVAKYKNMGIVQLETDTTLILLEQEIDKYFIEGITNTIMDYSFDSLGIIAFDKLNTKDGMDIAEFLALESNYFTHILTMKNRCNEYIDVYCRQFMNQYHLITLMNWRDWCSIGAYNSTDSAESIDDNFCDEKKMHPCYVGNIIECKVLSTLYSTVNQVVLNRCIKNNNYDNNKQN